MIALLLLILAPLPLWAQPVADAGAQTGVVETVVAETPSRDIVEGRLDWTAGVLVVTGEGVAPETVTHPVQRRLLGFRAAKLVAYRKLLEIVGVVQVDARTTVSMAMVASDTIRAAVEGLVRGATVVPGSRRQQDGMYLLDLRLHLLEGLADAVLPPSSPVEEPLPAQLPASDSVLVFVPPKPYTGLIVDARGTSLRPSLAPRIIDDTGRVIYSAAHVEREYAVRTGIVGYERELAAAAANERLGGDHANPMIVDAVRADGLYNSDVVVTRDTGTRIKMADMEGDFLTDCRVIFLVGPRPEPALLSADADLLDTLMGHLPPDSLAADSLGLQADVPLLLDE